jgi:replication initiation protein RepC
MPTPIPTANEATGHRRISPAMFDHLKRSDAFDGLPHGAANQWKVLAAFQEAEPYLGLPALASKLVTWLVKQTFAVDWDASSRPIAWPQADAEAEFLGITLSQTKRLNRALFEAGIFVMRDDPQGRRRGKRDRETRRILWAYGFDLSPLAQRYDEFVRIAAEAQIERDHVKAARRRIRIAHRTILQIGEQLAAANALPECWPDVLAQATRLLPPPKRAMLSVELMPLVKAIEQRRDEAARLLELSTASASDPVEMHPLGRVDAPHNTTTNLIQITPDTVIASEESSSPGTIRTEAPSRANFAERGLRIYPQQLIDLAPRLAGYISAQARHRPQWHDIVSAATELRAELGVSASLWGEACLELGREPAAIAIAIISTKPAAFFTRGAGAYFAGMVKKHQRGELNLDRTLWKLKSEKWGLTVKLN